MKNCFIFGFCCFFYTLQAFAAWNMSCLATDGTKLELSESSLSFESVKYNLEFSRPGEVLVFYSDNKAVPMSIHALRRESLDRDLVFYLGYDYLRFDAPNLKETPEFDTLVRVERHKEHRTPELESFSMHCKAT